MSLPPMPLREFREYLLVLKGLLRGEEVEYGQGDSARPIRFLHAERGMIDLDGPIPVMLGVFGPKGLDLAGSLGDGLVTFWGGRTTSAPRGDGSTPPPRRRAET